MNKTSHEYQGHEFTMEDYTNKMWINGQRVVKRSKIQRVKGTPVVDKIIANFPRPHWINKKITWEFRI